MSIYTPAEQANINRVTGGWKRVENGLPKPYSDPHLFRRVMVWCLDYGTHGFYLGHYIPALKEWRIEGSPNAWNVTHWMVPQPPEG